MYSVRCIKDIYILTYVYGQMRKTKKRLDITSTAKQTSKCFKKVNVTHDKTDIVWVTPRDNKIQ